MDKKQYILAVPNFSEGKRTDVIEAIVDEVRKIKEVTLISYEPEEEYSNDYKYRKL